MKNVTGDVLLNA